MGKKMNKDIKAGADIHTGDGGYSEGTQEEYENFAKIRNQSLLKMRLREFERASGLEIYGLGAKRVPWEAAMEKFAKLIVRECVSVINTEAGEHEDDDEYERAWKMGTEFAVYQIKQHFGVEE